MNYSLSLSLSLSLSFFWSLLLNEEKIWIKLSLNSLVCSFSLFLSLSSAALLLQIFFLSLRIKKEEIEKFGSFRVVSSQFFFVLFLSLLSSLLSSINNTHTHTHTLEKRRRQKRENRFYRKKTEEIETLSYFSPSCSSSFVVVSLGYIYIIIIIRKRD